LFVLGNIHIELSEDETVAPSGGICSIYDPWTPEEDALTPIGYGYLLAQPRLGFRASSVTRMHTRLALSANPDARQVPPKYTAGLPEADNGISECR
jgi:hypothetical protein